MSDMRPILIAGPTASGKSGLALRLAEHLGGVVINADSHAGLSRAAGPDRAPRPGEEARVPHALYGFVQGSESYSAGRYAADVARALDEARARRPPPDHRRRHRAVLQDADSKACHPFRRFPRRARPLARRRPQDGRRRTFMMCSRRAIRKWLRASQPTTRSASCARSRCWTRRVCRSPSGSGAAASRCSTSPTPFRSSSRSSGTSSCARIDGRFAADDGGRRVGRGAATQGARSRPVAAAHDGARGSPVLRHLDGELSLEEAIAPASSTPASTPNGSLRGFAAI